MEKRKNIKWTEDLFEELVMKPLEEGLTITEIAEEIGLTRQTVTIRLQYYGMQNKTEALLEIIRRKNETIQNLKQKGEENE